MRIEINKRLEVLSDRIRKGISVSVQEALEVIVYQERLMHKEGVKSKIFNGGETMTKEHKIRLLKSFKEIVLQCKERGGNCEGCPFSYSTDVCLIETLSEYEHEGLIEMIDEQILKISKRR